MHFSHALKPFICGHFVNTNLALELHFYSYIFVKVTERWLWVTNVENECAIVKKEQRIHTFLKKNRKPCLSEFFSTHLVNARHQWQMPSYNPGYTTERTEPLGWFLLCNFWFDRKLLYVHALAVYIPLIPPQFYERASISKFYQTKIPIPPRMGSNHLTMLIVNMPCHVNANY